MFIVIILFIIVLSVCHFLFDHSWGSCLLVASFVIIFGVIKAVVGRALLGKTREEEEEDNPR